MQFSGTLRSWDDGRGFGFIAPTHGGPDVFVHISALPRDGTRPTVGERLTYELAQGRHGKPQACRVVRQAFGDTRAVAMSAAAQRPARRSSADSRGVSILGTLLVFLLIAVAAGWGWRQHVAATRRATPATQPATASAPDAVPPVGRNFRCDGRTHCSQMTSCEEATWFINHCPGTQMDGNRDGVPCEQQWCSSPLSR